MIKSRLFKKIEIVSLSLENTNDVLNNFQFKQHFDDREHLKQKLIKLYNQYEQFQLFKNEFLTHISIELESDNESERGSRRENTYRYKGLIESFKLTCMYCKNIRCLGECEKSKSTVPEKWNKGIAITRYELNEKRNITIPKFLVKPSIKIPKLYMFDLNIVSMSEKKPSSYYKPQLIEIALDNRTFVDYYKSQEYEDQFHYNEFYKREKYLQEKSSYQSLIENLFKENIIFEDDFCIEQYSDYIYHYTDAESALSILADETIYPNEQGVFLTDIGPNNQDLIIGAVVFEEKLRELSGHIDSKLHKLEFAFGFKKDEILGKEPDTFNITKDRKFIVNDHTILENEIWIIPTEIGIKLRDQKFILIAREFNDLS